MILIIGLGNPGIKFNNTRHNVGFMAVDEFRKRNEFPLYEPNKKAVAFISKKNDVTLVKPQTFMNESGKAVKELIKNSPVENIVIVHDDIDLPVGKIKIIKERGSAGHKGVESIIKSIGNDGLIRIRIGIGQQGDVKAKKIVLKKFSGEEQKLIDEVISKSAEAIDSLIKNGLEKSMNEFNK